MVDGRFNLEVGNAVITSDGQYSLLIEQVDEKLYPGLVEPWVMLNGCIYDAIDIIVVFKQRMV